MSTKPETETGAAIEGSTLGDATVVLRGHEQLEAAMYACINHRMAAEEYELRELEDDLAEIVIDCKNLLGSFPGEPELAIDDLGKISALYEAIEYVVEGSLPGALDEHDREVLEPIHRAIGELDHSEDHDLEGSE
jgi:hypothetical protein